MYIFYYHPTNNCVFSLLVSCNCLSPSFIIFTSFMLKPPYQRWLNTSNFTRTHPNPYGFSWPQRGDGARMRHPWSNLALPHCHPYQVSSSELLSDFVKWHILERLKNFEWMISGGKNLDLLYWLIQQSWLNNNELLKKKSSNAQKIFHFYKIWKKCLVGGLTSNFLEGLISTQIHNMSLWVEGTYHCTKELAIIILMFHALLY